MTVIVTALARFLVKKELSQHRPVGVYMERSIDAVVAFYSVIHVPREEHAGVFARLSFAWDYDIDEDLFRELP